MRNKQYASVDAKTAVRVSDIRDRDGAIPTAFQHCFACKQPAVTSSVWYLTSRYRPKNSATPTPRLRRSRKSYAANSIRLLNSPSANSTSTVACPGAPPPSPKKQLGSSLSVLSF